MAFSEAEHERWLRELYATKPEPRPTDIASGVFERYLAEQNVCNAGIESARGKSFREFYETCNNAMFMLAGLRIATAKLIGKPHLLDIAELAFKCADLAKADPHDELGHLNPNSDLLIVVPGRVSQDFLNQATYSMGSRPVLTNWSADPLPPKFYFDATVRCERIAEIRRVHGACCTLIRNSKIITF